MTDPGILRPFLDANILFSAAYRDSSGMRKLWSLDGVALVTSHYAVEEATKNLAATDQKADLQGLLTTVDVVYDPTPPAPLFRNAHDLPDKDCPILWAAIDWQCTHLITGDVAHFGHLLNTVADGVMIVRAAKFFEIHHEWSAVQTHGKTASGPGEEQRPP